MGVAVRVFFALALIAQVAAVMAERQSQRAYEGSDYVEMTRTGLIALAAVAALVLVGFMVTSLGVAWLRDEGGVLRWVFLAVNLLCLIAQVVSFLGQHTVVYLVFGAGHLVSGVLLCTWAGAQRVAI